MRTPILCLAACCALAGSSPRLYVEPFVTMTGSRELREHLIERLRKDRSVRLTSTEAAADLILGGGGEIWVRGYSSLNPRSGRSPSGGTPVYAGYLSVELRDRAGDTLWSYLAVPHGGSTDTYQDLSKQIAKRVAQAIDEVQIPSRQQREAQPRTVLKAAGATFPYPVYAKWFTNYERANQGIVITYDRVGSAEGLRKLFSGAVDFAASDNPEAVPELYLLFPSVVGAVVPIVNLPGVSGEIAFTPEGLAGIYLGRITKWNDPILRKSNPGLRLPDMDIVVLHRGEGSGTSYAWTQYLSKISPEWSARAGAGFNPRWPTGRAVAGNDATAKLVKELGGSIGYVEFIYALQNHLSFGKVRNRHGEFVSASLESIDLAARDAGWRSDDFKVSILDPPGPGAYPISTFTWFVVPASIPDEASRTAIVSFLRWMLGPGQKQAAALGYVSLPRDVIAREEQAIARIH